MQASCRNKAIATVISLTAENRDAVCRRVLREHILRHSAACVLHQRERRNAKALASSAVDSPHFFGGNDFHKGVVLLIVDRWRNLYVTSANRYRPILKQKGSPHVRRAF
jgi:hypothetical protein